MKTRRFIPATAPGAVPAAIPGAVFIVVFASGFAAVFTAVFTAVLTIIPTVIRAVVFFMVLVAALATGSLFADHWNGSGVARAATPGAAHARAAVQPTPAISSKATDSLWNAPLTRPDGKPQSLARYKGRPVVVNFWASWCAPCVGEMPALSALQREYAKKGIQFVGVGVDSVTNVATFLQKVRVDYPIYVAGFGGTELARTFGDNAGGLPFTLVIDAKGAIRATKLGPVKPEELRRTLDAL